MCVKFLPSFDQIPKTLPRQRTPRLPKDLPPSKSFIIFFLPHFTELPFVAFPLFQQDKILNAVFFHCDPWLFTFHECDENQRFLLKEIRTRIDGKIDT